MEHVTRFLEYANDTLLAGLGLTVLQPTAIIPSLGIALLVYLLVTRQLEMIGSDDELTGDEATTAGERNEWLGGPTAEWLGI